MTRFSHLSPFLATLGFAAILLALVGLPGAPPTAAHADEGADEQRQQEARETEARDRDGRAERRRYGRYRGAAPGRPPFHVIESPPDEEQVERALETLDEMQPRLAARLRTLREENPERFQSHFARVGPHALFMAHLRENDPTAYDLRLKEHELGIQAMHLGRQARSADAPEAEQEYREQLKQVLEKQFEIRTQLLEHEMAQLEDRLEGLREKLDQQKEQRSQHIERRYEMILRFSQRGDRGDRGDREESDDDRNRDR